MLLNDWIEQHPENGHKVLLDYITRATLYRIRKGEGCRYTTARQISRVTGGMVVTHEIEIGKVGEYVQRKL